MSQIHMSQSITFSKCTFLISVDSFRGVRTVRLFVRFYKPLALQTMALCAINYGSFQLKVPQTLIAGTSFSDSGNVKRWERLRRSVFFNNQVLEIKEFLHRITPSNLVV